MGIVDKHVDKYTGQIWDNLIPILSREILSFWVRLVHVIN